LSRSGKKVLHVDGNGYYGGSEAALSLQEAEEWVYGLGEDLSASFSYLRANPIEGSPAEFSDACISQPQLADTDGPKLSVSRAYSLALAPHLIYNQSKLLHYLVVSKVYRQLEFQAMGSWWVYTTSDGLGDSGTEDSKQKAPGRLLKVPTNREDVAFSDSDLDLRSKRAVMKVLRFISDYENQLEIWEPYRSKPFVDFLTEHFKLPDSLKGLFLALTLSRNPPSQTSTGFALPRISRHLRSIGRLGPGFSSVIPKWGGLSEVVQVACRAGAVGGGIYVLGNGIAKVEHGSTSTKDDADTADTNNSVKVRLTGGDIVRTKVIVGLSDSLPVSDPAPAAEITASSSPSSASCSITIVSSTLESLYPVLAEGTPPPAGAIVVFPSGSLTTNKTSAEDTPPVYLTIHSAATGECPSGQSKSRLSTLYKYATDSNDDQTVTNTYLHCLQFL
jgi:Rab proteins geranylgeranyltransferase component A